MESPYYIFRELESLDELKSLLILRFSLRSRTRLAPCKGYACDIDVFDLRSFHFGLYEHRKETSRPVGYMRVVTQHDSPMKDGIERIAGCCPGLARRLGTALTVPFPVVSKLPNPQPVLALCMKAESQHESIVETDAVLLDSSVCSETLERDFFQSAIAACMVREVRHYIQLGSSPQTHMHRLFGFCDLKGTERAIGSNGENATQCLRGSIGQLSEGVRDRVLAMGEAFWQTGRIHISQLTPEAFYPPLSSYVPSRNAVRAAA